MTDVFGILCERGYVAGMTEPIEEIHELLKGRTTIYQGFDPTAPSLHVGHLESLMVLHHLQRAGHRIIFLIGGATALVGDPTGRVSSRPLLKREEIDANADAIRRQVQNMGLLRFDEAEPGITPALLVNNADWLDMGLLMYLRDIARHFSVNALLRHETFASRLADQQHLSLMEFLYPTLQSYDFLYLFDMYRCRLQVGGKDQWTNIMDGIDLIRRLRGERVHGLVFPLLTDRSGQKMGKTSEGETIWLDPERTSPFAFYQYWLRCPDEDLKRNLEMFTFLSISEIERVVAGHPRQAQHRLAFEVTKIVHGEEAARRAQEDAMAAFGSAGTAPQDVPAFQVTPEDLQEGLSVVQMLRRAGAVSSLSAARRLIRQGGVRLNGVKISDVDRLLSLDDFDDRDGQAMALVRYGKGKVLKLMLPS